MATILSGRWLRFSLRGMLVLVMLCAVWLGWQVSLVRERRAILADRAEQGDIPHTRQHPSWLRHWMRDEALDHLIVWSGGAQESPQTRRLQRVFPEARIIRLERPRGVQGAFDITPIAAER